MRHRGAWRRGRKTMFTGNLADYTVGRKTDCRNRGCPNIMYKGELHYAAEVEGYSPIMAPGICERPTPFGSPAPYVLICRQCGDRKIAEPNFALRRK